jgi:hypothetical protein
MARLCWRLLAAFVLILFAFALRGQDSGSRVPVLKQEFAPHYSAPAWIPLPNSLAGGSVTRYPVGGDPPIPGSFAFPQVVQIAGMIFSGHVTAVGHGNGSPGPASTTVSFQVEQAIRGVSAGQTLTIHEWASLWTSGERYRVGEHVFLFLYPPSKLGLTSPVAGNMGRFAVDSRGMVVLTPQHVAALLPDPVLGGRTFIPYKDFALAVQRFSGRE